MFCSVRYRLRGDEFLRVMKVGWHVWPISEGEDPDRPDILECKKWKLRHLASAHFLSHAPVPTGEEGLCFLDVWL